MFRKIILVFLLLLQLSVSAKTTNEFQSWNLVTLTKDLDEKWSMYFEVQDRINNSVTQEGLLIIRPAIEYKLNKTFSLWQGYAWTPNFAGHGMLNENRLWQQIAFGKKFSKISILGWSRLEERFIENADTMSLRSRTRVGISVPLFNLKTWKLLVFDEFFVNLYNVTNGPAAGFDQNWSFVGFEKIFNENLNMSAGYLLNYLNRSDDAIQHAIRLQLNITI